MICAICSYFFFQAEDGIRDLVRSRGLGDVYKRQHQMRVEERQARMREMNMRMKSPAAVAEYEREPALSLIHI